MPAGSLVFARASVEPILDPKKTSDRMSVARPMWTRFLVKRHHRYRPPESASLNVQTQFSLSGLAHALGEKVGILRLVKNLRL